LFSLIALLFVVSLPFLLAWNDGKVCLSLLGTWEGPKWNPKHSSLYQLLISIQGLILGVEHPYYLEPGHGGWEGEVKEGDFRSKGQTLKGEMVVEELGVPQKVVLYEDQIRVGTVKYALLDILNGTVGRDSKASSRKYLQPFVQPVQAHFCQNGSQIFSEVQSWLSDTQLGRKRENNNASLPIDEVNILLPKLKNLLSSVVGPDLGPDANADVVTAIDPLKQTQEVGGDDVAMAAVYQNDEERGQGDALDVLKPKRQRMQEAAASGDYVLAGQLQGEIKRVEDLHKLMTEAAEQHDFIRAGRLQAQLKALTEQEDSPSHQNPGISPSAAPWQDEEDSFDSDEEMDEAPPSGMAPFGMGGPPLGGVGQQNQHHPPHGLGKNVLHLLVTTAILSPSTIHGVLDISWLLQRQQPPRLKATRQNLQLEDQYLPIASAAFASDYLQTTLRLKTLTKATSYRMCTVVLPPK
jgi:hypothetical protein